MTTIWKFCFLLCILCDITMIYGQDATNFEGSSGLFDSDSSSGDRNQHKAALQPTHTDRWKVVLRQLIDLTTTPKPIAMAPTIRFEGNSPTRPSTILKTVNYYEGFNTKLFHELSPKYADVNMVYSPISVQMLLAYIYMGAKGQTAEEMYTTLCLANTPRGVLEGFQKLLAVQRLNTGSQLVMANKLYHAADLTVKIDQSYNGIYFNSTSEPVNFKQRSTTANQINQWVTEATGNRIRNIITDDNLNVDTQALLVNAIYFKAKWATQFSSSDTERQTFFLPNNKTTQVEMMYIEDAFRCAYLPELNAKAVELPYENDKMSMLFILPNDINGLPELERKLANKDLSQISAMLKTEPIVTIRIPRFNIDFDLDMVEPLIELGMRTVFSNEADLSNFFEYTEKPLGISKIQHKATITVNEAGSEAAAASFADLVPLSLPPNQFIFTANHPFLFAIRGSDVVYFIGHVIKPISK